MKALVPIERITSKIYLIRNVKVMLDRDLAELYGVETKRLKEQVRRNIERFPEDFMFELTKDELGNWRSQFATSNQDIMGLRNRSRSTLNRHFGCSWLGPEVIHGKLFSERTRSLSRYG